RCVSALRLASALSRRTASSVHVRSCGRRGRRSTTGTRGVCDGGGTGDAGGVCGAGAAVVGRASLLACTTLAEQADSRAPPRAAGQQGCRAPPPTRQGRVGGGGLLEGRPSDEDDLGTLGDVDEVAGADDTLDTGVQVSLEQLHHVVGQ